MVGVDHVWVIQREAETEDAVRGDPPKRCLPLRQRPEVQTLLWSCVLLAEQAAAVCLKRPREAKFVGQRAVGVSHLQPDSLARFDGFASLPGDNQSIWVVLVI